MRKQQSGRPHASLKGGASSDPVMETRVRQAQMDAVTTYVPAKTSRNGVVFFGAAVFLVFFCAVTAAFALLQGAVTPVALAVALVVGGLAASSIHIALNWEKVVVLRFGKVSRVVGPGLYLTIPVVEHGTICIDQRTVATPFYAEQTLTADLVPITVDAVLFWMVWDVEKACTEVEDYFGSVSFLAQTALREAVGRKTVAEVATSRDELDAEIKAEVERIAANWGVDVIDVKVRDIIIPDALQDAMSIEAQAERERAGRLAVADVEVDLAEVLTEAGRVYGDPEAALKLRTMLMQYETVKKSGGTVVTVPTAVSDGFTEGVDGKNGR
ncbi:MAG: slipin family protein [Coriobacteriia bacterium]|nr:slipin family protein [Coriobacteriia bacterium]